MVHPSFYEGFNLPLVEAMDAGTPLIVSNLEVHHEVAGNAALFFEPDQADSIGLAMHQFVHNKNLQHQLKQEAEKQAQLYNWEKTAEETLYVYDLYT